MPSGGVQELIPFVRRSLARNRQQMLATMVRMGMQRIVIDSGKITASMKFRIDATSAAIPEPMRPATRREVKTGPISRRIASEEIFGT